MNPPPSRADFGAALGSPFRIGAVPGLGGPALVVLATVDDRRTAAGWECFSMLFEEETASGLSQGTFPVAHDALGEFELFFVPIRNPTGKPTYEAIVYRPLSIGPGAY